MGNEPSRRLFLSTALGAIGTTWTAALGQQQDPAPAPAAKDDNFPPPEPIQAVILGPTLKTHPVRRTDSGFVDGVTGKTVFNEKWIDASVLPRDKKGIFVLNFAYKPLRITQVDLPGKGRRDIHYLYYQVVNRTGEPRMFVPQFTLITDTGKRFEDKPIPQAVNKIKYREGSSIENLYGAVAVMGMIPPSTKQGVDDAVFGVAVWEGVDPKADKLQIFVTGLSDGQRQDSSPDGKPVIRHKALQLDFIRRGDHFDQKEREITLGEPPYDWTYR
jgi:hypothetical protein